MSQGYYLYVLTKPGYDATGQELYTVNQFSNYKEPILNKTVYFSVHRVSLQAEIQHPSARNGG